MSTKDWLEKDYYKILGVSKNASSDDIRKAFRKIARENHPDQNPGNDPAEARFKEASEANAVLSDSAKRKEYDEARSLFGAGARFGRPGAGGAGAAGFEDLFRNASGTGAAGASNLGDLFGGLFSGSGATRRSTARGPRRGADIEGEVTISFEQSIDGATVSMRTTSDSPCAACRGTGAKAGTLPKVCPTCEGSGMQSSTAGGVFSMSEPCRDCLGRGLIVEEPCPDCAGSGRGRSTRTMNVRIPAGVSDGQRIRIKGRGAGGENGGSAGDLYFTVHVSPHKLFGRDGHNLTLDVPVTFAEASLGAEITIPTITGSKVRLRVPSGTPNGRVLRVRGKGITTKAGTGDLLVTVQVVVPQRLSGEAKKAVEAFAKATEGADVRAEDETLEDFEALTDAELAAKTAEFRERYSKGETLDDLLPEAFAVARILFKLSRDAHLGPGTNGLHHTHQHQAGAFGFQERTYALSEALAERHQRLPAENLASPGDVGPARFRIILGERAVLEYRAAVRHRQDELGQLADGELAGVADVRRIHAIGVEEAEDAVHEVVDVGERAGLLPLTVDRDRIPAQCLHDEIADHSAVRRPHTRAESVEDADDARLQPMEPVIGHRHGLGEALGFVVNSPRTHRVHVPPVLLRLRMHLRVAIHLGSGSEQVARTLCLGEAQRLVGPEGADLQGGDRLLEIVDRARGAGEVKHPVERPLHVDEVRHVVLDELELLSPDQMGDVVRRAGDEIVHTHHPVTLCEEAVTEMGAKEAGGAGDEDAHSLRSQESGVRSQESRSDPIMSF